MRPPQLSHLDYLGSAGRGLAEEACRQAGLPDQSAARLPACGPDADEQLHSVTSLLEFGDELIDAERHACHATSLVNTLREHVRACFKNTPNGRKQIETAMPLLLVYEDRGIASHLSVHC